MESRVKALVMMTAYVRWLPQPVSHNATRGWCSQTRAIAGKRTVRVVCLSECHKFGHALATHILTYCGLSWFSGSFCFEPALLFIALTFIESQEPPPFVPDGWLVLFSSMSNMAGTSKILRFDPQILGMQRQTRERERGREWEERIGLSSLVRIHFLPMRSWNTKWFRFRYVFPAMLASTKQAGRVCCAEVRTSWG